MKSETSDERYERLSKSAPREATSPFSGSTPSAAEKPEDYGDVCMKLEETLRHWQDAIRDELIKLSGNDKIDGAGCDSGDPLDFTLAEIRQAWQPRHSGQAVDCPHCQKSDQVDADVQKQQRYCHRCQKAFPSGQAVDRQEWTENGAAIMAGEERIAWVGDLLARRAIIAAHNAELAAERQRREQAEADFRNADCEYQVVGFKKFTLDKRVKELGEQLLSALAAIEKFKAYLELYFLKGVLRFDDGHDYRQVARELIDVSPDLSLLHQHDAETRAQAKADVFRALNVTLDALNAPQDEWPCNRISKLAAEVRKPLVEALERCVDAMDTPELRHARCSQKYVHARKAGLGALAKVKEKS
jgi:hypothetical protein